MYGKETLSFDEVVGKTVYKERRMKSNKSMSTHSMMTIRSETHENKNYTKKMVC